MIQIEHKSGQIGKGGMHLVRTQAGGREGFVHWVHSKGKYIVTMTPFCVQGGGGWSKMPKNCVHTKWMPPYRKPSLKKNTWNNILSKSNIGTPYIIDNMALNSILQQDITTSTKGEFIKLFNTLPKVQQHQTDPLSAFGKTIDQYKKSLQVGISFCHWSNLDFNPYVNCWKCGV